MTEERPIGEQQQEGTGREVSGNFSAKGKAAKGCIASLTTWGNNRNLRPVSLPPYNTVLIISFKLYH